MASMRWQSVTRNKEVQVKILIRTLAAKLASELVTRSGGSTPLFGGLRLEPSLVRNIGDVDEFQADPTPETIRLTPTAAASSAVRSACPELANDGYSINRFLAVVTADSAPMWQLQSGVPTSTRHLRHDSHSRFFRTRSGNRMQWPEGRWNNSTGFGDDL